VLALTIKEMAYTLPLMMVALLWYEKSLSKYWRLAATSFLLAACAMAYRTYVLHGFGFRFGSNGSWLPRTIDTLLGIPGSQIAIGQFLPLTTVLIVAAVCYACCRRWKIAAAFAVAGLLAYSVTAFVERGAEDPIYLQWLIGSTWYCALLAGILGLFIVRTALRHDRGSIFAVSWLLVTYLPLITAPITLHALYLPALGCALWLAFGVADVVSLLGGYARRATAGVTFSSMQKG
jgi:hypothetical protein